MPATGGYIWEKTYLAVRGMARSPRPLHERVRDAYFYHLEGLTVHEIPDPGLRSKFESIRNRIIDDPQRYHASSEEEIAEIAGDIVSLYDAACRQYRS